MKINKGRQGFTLLEMLVATTIMAVAVVALLNGIGGSTRTAARLRDYDRVVQLARYQMNELLADLNTPTGQTLGGTFDPKLTGGLPVNWQARLTTVEVPAMRMIGQPSLERIELQVSWTSGNQPHSFTLDAHRTRFLKQGDL